MKIWLFFAIFIFLFQQFNCFLTFYECILEWQRPEVLSCTLALLVASSESRVESLDLRHLDWHNLISLANSAGEIFKLGQGLLWALEVNNLSPNFFNPFFSKRGIFKRFLGAFYNHLGRTVTKPWEYWYETMCNMMRPRASHIMIWHTASHNMMRPTASLCSLLLFSLQEAGWKIISNTSDIRVQIGVICNMKERENVDSQHEATGGGNINCFLRHPGLNSICDLRPSLPDHL